LGTEQSKLDFKQFGINLKKARGEANLTQSALGEMVGLDKNTIGNYERNAGEKGVVPNLENICAIADALNVSIDSLVGRKKDVPQKTTQTEMNGRVALDAFIWVIQEGEGNMIDSLPASAVPSPFPLCGEGKIEGIGFWISGKEAHELSKEVKGFLEASNSMEKSEAKIPHDVIVAAKGGMKSRLLDEYGTVFERDDTP